MEHKPVKKAAVKKAPVKRAPRKPALDSKKIDPLMEAVKARDSVLSYELLLERITEKMISGKMDQPERESITLFIQAQRDLNKLRQPKVELTESVKDAGASIISSNEAILRLSTDSLGVEDED